MLSFDCGAEALKSLLRGPASGRALMRVESPPALPQGPASADAELIQELIPDVDATHISPREIAEISMDLYIAGVLPWDEYALLAFQPELQPAYDETIGALIGEKAEPNRRRDFVAIWEERLVFERRYNGDDAKRIARVEHIAAVLRQITGRGPGNA